MLVLVVGPSGAGKDTLIAGARDALAGDERFAFPRRVVTRTAIATLEDHDSLDRSEFALREANGAYALSWEAHGLRYGVPAAILDDLAAGRVVVVNGSRAVVSVVRRRFDAEVVLVEAAAAVRASRLVARGRETSDEIASRLAREVPLHIGRAARVDNSGDLETGLARFVSILRTFADR